MKRATTASALIILSLAAIPPVLAADIVIDDPDPALVFDDSTDVSPEDGFEWVIRGRDEFFSIDAEVSGDHILYVEPSSEADRNNSILVHTSGTVSLANHTLTIAPQNGGSAYLNGPLFMDSAESALWISRYNPMPTPQTLMILENNGNTKFEIREGTTGKSWAFTNSGQDFRMSLQDSGVVEFRVDNNGDAYLAGLLFENSDRNAKTDFEDIDPEQVLDTVLGIPVMRWSYKESTDIRHMGPMAQDFRAAFGLGLNERSIAAIDLGGAALAAVQGLKTRYDRTLAERDAQIDALQARLLELESQQARMVAHMDQLVRQLANTGSTDTEPRRVSLQ